MKVEQSGSFGRRVKKLKPDEKKSLDKAIKKIMLDTSIGTMKTGDLSGVQVHKYKHNTQQCLLAYRVAERGVLLTLLALGTHENFYRDLKR
jgi:mRNA-degrading endonuclease YafQ of YafQ-DinJ toxin-antitoxin module